jgi:hypothetical protein
MKETSDGVDNIHATEVDVNQINHLSMPLINIQEDNTGKVSSRSISARRSKNNLSKSRSPNAIAKAVDHINSEIRTPKAITSNFNQ